MSIITDEFDKICQANSNKVAFYYERHGKIVSKTYLELYQEVISIATALTQNGISTKHRLLAFASPDYNLLKNMLAAFKIGASVMYVDIFAKQDSLKNFFNEYHPNYVLVSNKTKLVKPFFKIIRKSKIINVDKPPKPSKTSKPITIDNTTPALITSTTGSSSKPKAFIRTHEDLYHQLTLIRNNLKPVKSDEIVLTTSYIYAFANLIQGITTVLPNINLSLNKRPIHAIKKLNLFSKLRITTIMTSPDFCLNTPNLYPHLNRLYFGGAILNYHEATKIKTKFQPAEIWYIYGSTECALISGVNLNDYLDTLKKTGQCFLGNTCNGVKVSINENKHILVQSDALLKQSLSGKNIENYHDTNDIGKLSQDKLYYLGKGGTKVTIHGKNYYANEIEQQIVLKFPILSKCAICEYSGTNYAFLEGDINIEEIKRYLKTKFNIAKVIKLRQIPRDVKHHTKINYQELQQICQEAKQN